MKKQADYIKRIEIKGLWGRKTISGHMIACGAEWRRKKYDSEQISKYARYVGRRFIKQ